MVNSFIWSDLVVMVLLTTRGSFPIILTKYALETVIA